MRLDFQENHSKANLQIHWDITKKVGKKLHYLVECNICKCCVFRRIDQIDKSMWKCVGCSQHTLFLSSDYLDFDLVENQDSSSVLIKCRKCNCVKSVQRNHLRMGNVRCETCITKKYSLKLEESGCTYVSRFTKNKSNNSYVVYKDGEGVEKIVQAGHLLKDVWLDSRIVKVRPQKECVYVYKFSFIVGEHNPLPKGLYYKIGISYKPNKRLKKLKLLFKADVEIIAKCLNYREALKIEKQLHFENLNNKLSADVVAIFAKGKVNKKYPDGYTEWFFTDKDK
jgi:hypothetical protein